MDEDKKQEIGQSFLKSVSVSRMQELAVPSSRKSFEDLLHQIKADAGAIWIVDKDQTDALTIAVNVGARGSSIEGNISQSLDRGLVCKAFREDTLVHDQGTFFDPEQSRSVDMRLGQQTNYQLAMPFFMFEHKIGAVTAVQVSTLENPLRKEWGFTDQAVEDFQHWVAVAQRLFEYECVNQA